MPSRHGEPNRGIVEKSDADQGPIPGSIRFPLPLRTLTFFVEPFFVVPPTIG